MPQRAVCCITCAVHHAACTTCYIFDAVHHAARVVFCAVRAVYTWCCAPCVLCCVLCAPLHAWCAVSSVLSNACCAVCAMRCAPGAVQRVLYALRCAVSAVRCCLQPPERARIPSTAPARLLRVLCCSFAFFACIPIITVSASGCWAVQLQAAPFGFVWSQVCQLSSSPVITFLQPVPCNKCNLKAGLLVKEKERN